MVLIKLVRKTFGVAVSRRAGDIFFFAGGLCLIALSSSRVESCNGQRPFPALR